MHAGPRHFDNKAARRPAKGPGETGSHNSTQEASGGHTGENRGIHGTI